MATLTRAVVVAAALAGCGKVSGFGGTTPPLASFTVTPTGTVAGAPSLQLALVWGRQWLVEPLCILPIDSRDDAAKVSAVIAAGCRDPFGFVPARVAASVPATLGQPSTIDLFSLPSADLLVGDLTARVGYATIVLYDDRDGDGTLDLAQPNRPMDRPPNPNDLPVQTRDVPYGASFLAMTEPDTRIGYREGAFIQSGFFPRVGCGDPPPAFSVLSASGFTAQAAIDATLAGTLPAETDPTACAQAAPADAAITVTAMAATDPDVSELKCSERLTDSTVRYREPPLDAAPDLTNRVSACVHYPSFGDPSDVVEFVVSGIISGPTPDSCAGLTHYILKGCNAGITCGTGNTWDHSAAPPSWWPC